jgi:hypothetical protein
MDFASSKSTASEVTAVIEAREFSVAAGALYRYWVGQLCDTSIKNSKPMPMPDVPERERKSAQQTLYTAVEGGLLLMHPIIPFITEVLWQRLPRRQGDRTESIMLVRYPEFEMALDAPQATAEYEFLLDISAGIRSLLSRYDFKEGAPSSFRHIHVRPSRSYWQSEPLFFLWGVNTWARSWFCIRARTRYLHGAVLYRASILKRQSTFRSSAASIWRQNGGSGLASWTRRGRRSARVGQL